MFYSKTGKTRTSLFDCVVSEKCADPRANRIDFYWHLFDDDDGVPLEQSLSKKNLEILKNHPRAYMHIDYDGEYITYIDTDQVNTLIKSNEIPSNKIFVYVQDKNHKDFFDKRCSSNTVSTFKHYRQQRGPSASALDVGKKRFSFLSRRHTPWRFKFAKCLYEKKILKNAHWSYLGIDNEIGNILSPSVNKKRKKTKKDFYNKLPKRIVPNDGGDAQQHISLYNAIHASKIHILVESEYDQMEMTGLDCYNFDAAPADVSEKAFKAVICKRPFVVFATPYWLQGFKDLGFKTFAPFICEDYDLEEDNEKRMAMIVKEIERLNNLSPKDIENLVRNLEEIVNHNYSVWKQVYDLCGQIQY